MFKKVLGSGLIFLLFSLSAFADDSLTITTYYPSPYGVYRTMRLYPNTGFTPGAACANEGEMSFSQTNHVVYTCSGSPLKWQSLAGYWAASGNDIYNINTGKVGIGMQIPNYALDVHGTVHADGGDLAEGILSTGDVEPGDVVVIDESARRIKKANQPYDPKAAGVIAEFPGLRIGPGTGKEYKPLSLVGQVPCKVTVINGPIKPGDLLTTSSKPGYAMKLKLLSFDEAQDISQLKAILKENEKRSLSVIGKALEPLEKKDGKIIILLGR